MREKVAAVARALNRVLKRRSTCMSERKWWLIRCIRAEKLTFLTMSRLRSLSDACGVVELDGVPRMIVEAGCPLDGSSILLASLKDQARSMRIYVVFGMTTPPTNEDTDEVHARYALIRSGHPLGSGETSAAGAKVISAKPCWRTLLDLATTARTTAFA